MTEEWQPVRRYEQLYFVSSRGRLMRVKQAQGARAGLILKPWNSGGYRHFSLTKNGQRRTISGHRLVVDAFLGPIPEGMQVNHKNGIKHDNRPENLEIVTLAENTRHSFYVLGRNMSKGSEHYRAKLTKTDVLKIRALHNEGINKQAIANEFGVCRRQVGRIVDGERWAHLS